MLRLLLVTSLLMGCLAILNCQSYSTGLQQGGARVDEGAAIANLRAISRAQTTYSISNPGDYATFEQLATGGYLDGRFNKSKPKFYGYVFTMNVTPKSASQEGSFSLNADPELQAGGRHFYLDSSRETIHVNATQTATASDAAVEP